MHERLRLADLAAEGLDDRLVAEADAERRDCGPSRRMSSIETPGVAGRPGPGEMTRCVGASALRLVRRDRVVADDVHLGAELLEEVREVVGERVVVVDQQDHAGTLLRQVDRRLERGELVQALLVLVGRVGVGDDPGARLEVARRRR